MDDKDPLEGVNGDHRKRIAGQLGAMGLKSVMFSHVARGSDIVECRVRVAILGKFVAELSTKASGMRLDKMGMIHWKKMVGGHRTGLRPVVKAWRTWLH